MKLLTFIISVSSVFISLPAFAYNDNRLTCQQRGDWINPNEESSQTYQLAFDKQGRGVENTLFGLLEIPEQTVKKAIETDCSSCYFSGLFTGIGYFIVRELTGFTRS